MKSQIFQTFVLFILGILFAPCLAVYFSFYGDVWHLASEYKFLHHITDEWELLLVFGLFWFGFFCLLSFWKASKRLMNMPPKLEWWQTESIYQIFIKSFYDSNGDGIGDFRGIIEKLDYIKSIGCNIIWLTPCYPSDEKDGGYDITNFIDVDPIYGSMNDFDELVRKVHEKDMYILLDFVPNHTSDKHDWFKRSCLNNDSDNQYRDYYVWYESEDSVNPPNNWRSVFGGSMWTYCESRKAWYLHQFLKEQPDLNFRNPLVRQEMKNILKFWLENKDVDGFRIDALKHLFESDNWEEEPVRPGCKLDPCDPNLHYDEQIHIHTTNQLGTYQELAEWRAIFEEVSKKTGRTRAIISEATYNVWEIGEYYWYKNKPTSHLALNFQLSIAKKKYSETDPGYYNGFIPINVKRMIDDYYKYLQKGSWGCWTTGNHDQWRMATRVGREYINISNTLNLLLGGTAVVYYGEEIGMDNLPEEELSFECCKDQRGIQLGPEKYLQRTRDLQRTPMQWDSSLLSGFTTNNKTYLPVNSNNKYINVSDELKDSTSYLNIFKDLMQLRRLPSFQWGKLDILVVNNHIFSFTRRAYGFPVYLVVMNFSNEVQNVNLCINNTIAPRAYVLYYISGTNNEPNGNELIKDELYLSEKYKVKSPVLTKNVFLNAYDCLILTWPFSD